MTSPPRIPGARALRLGSLASSLPVRPPAAPEAVRPAAEAAAMRRGPRLPGSCHTPSGTSDGRPTGQSRAGWTQLGRENPPTPPTPGWRGRAGGPGWGSAELRVASGAADGEAGSSFACSAFPARCSPPLAPAGGSARADGLCPRPPAPSLVPRAFLGRHLFATRSLLPQVCLGACEHSSARLSTFLQPALPGQHASPPVKRGRHRPSAPLLARPRCHLALLIDDTRT